MHTRAGRWTGYVVIAILFAIACGFLSHWQFSRNEQRSAANALIENNYDADPIALDDVVTGTDEFDAAEEWQPVEVTGTYLQEDQLFVRNRPQNGSNGFEVLVPLQLDDGRILWVDRGWAVPGDTADAPEDVPDAPDGEVTVVVRLRPSEPAPLSGRGAPEGQLPTIHLPLTVDVTGEETIVSAYGILVSEDPAPAAGLTPIAEPEIDPGPHLSYAIQWILFAIMGFVFIGYMIRTELHARDDEDEEDEDGPPPRRQRKRDVDMETEDAILDAVE